MLGFASHFGAGFQLHQIVHELHNECSGPESEKCKLITQYCFISIKLATILKRAIPVASEGVGES